VYKVDIADGSLETIIDDWSLFYLYDVAFDGSYFYVNEWDLNRYELDGTKDGVAAFDGSVMGSAWDGTHFWTLDDENHMRCWDTSTWPAVTAVPANDFAPPSPSCRGLWHDGESFWTAESLDGALGRIYRFDEQGTVIREWIEPAFNGWSACVVRADAAVEMIVDDGDPGFHELAGNWRSRTYPDAHEGTLRFVPAGSGERWAAWRVDETLPSPGTYDVYVWKFDHPRSDDMSPSVRYKIRHRDGTSGWIPVDQSTPGDEWIRLGAFEFDASRPQGVVITDRPDGFVIADAIRLVRTTVR
jgi:hypothetical protein